MNKKQLNRNITNARCSNCGGNLKNNYQWCPYCGENLNQKNRDSDQVIADALKDIESSKRKLQHKESKRKINAEITPGHWLMIVLMAIPVILSFIVFCLYVWIYLKFGQLYLW